MLSRSPESRSPESPRFRGSESEQLSGNLASQKFIFHLMSDTLYLIDTFSLIFQVFHGLPEMTGPKGQPTNAIYGIARDLKLIIEQHQPTHLICAMDSPGAGVRKEIYPQYKANRSEMPEDLVPQIANIYEVIEGYNIPTMEQAGWEADDVIATVAVQAEKAGMEVCIVSSDKDLRQLLTDRVRMFNCRKNSIYDSSHLQEDWGIRPDQVVDFQALVGDSIDNIPGVPLVGPKKASALINQFETLDGVLEHPDDAPGPKLRENLKTFADQARLSKKLAKLKTDLPIEIDWDQARVTEPNRKKLHSLFTEFGFRRFSEEMLTDHSPEKKKDCDWQTIDTKKSFGEFLKKLKAQKRFCVDLETTGLNPRQADIVGWAISWESHTGFYIPVDGPRGQKTVSAKEVLSALKPILEDPQREICNQNIKYDMQVLKRVEVEIANVGMDPMVGDYLLDAGERGHGLDKLAEKYLQHKMIPISELIGKGNQQKKMFEVDIEKAAEYAVEDADITWQLCECLTGKLKKENLWELYWDLERKLIPVLAEMEFTGICVNVEELKSQSKELAGRLTVLMEEIYELAGKEFNIDSPKQLSRILYEELDLPVLKKTKTGASTAQDVLEKLAPMHPLPAKIMEHRHYSKLKSTYLDALPLLIDSHTKRIHTTFHQTVAATGRLSSIEPNLQNIPIRTEEGRRIRKAFVAAEENWLLLCADYSQVELRILAHFSGDVALKHAFQEGADIHTSVAAEVFNIDPDDVDSDQRRVAKAVNFGVIYGQSPFGLAETLKIPQDQAAAFIEQYFHKYDGVDRYLQSLLKECDRTGFARTILGRRRAISGIRSTIGRQRNLAERTAINTVVQGSAADLIKKAMIKIHHRLAEELPQSKMLLQIHDELVFELPANFQNELIAIVKPEMENALKLDVPLVVDMKIGYNWLETKPVEPNV